MLPLALGWTAPKLVYALLGLTLLGLLVKNLPAIRVTNGPQLETYARLAISVLPPEGAVLLQRGSDPPGAAARGSGPGRQERALHAGGRQRVAYGALSRLAWEELSQVLARAARPHPLAAPTNAPLDGAALLRLTTMLAQSNRVFYLHPGFGYLLEHFYCQPRGLLYELIPYPTNAPGIMPLMAPELAENRAFWGLAIETGVNPLARLIAQTELPRPGAEGRFREWLHLKTTSPSSLKGPALWYSVALNSWGATLQRNDRLNEAGPFFTLASELNPDSLPARLNLQCNRDLLAGQTLTLSASKANEEQFGRYRNWNQIVTRDGPCDEPGYCYQLGMAYAQRNLWRQAGEQFERVNALAPKDIGARLLQGALWNRCRQPDQALQVAAAIQADPSAQPLNPKLKIDLAFLEAEAWLIKSNQTKAEGVLGPLLESDPGNTALLERTKTVFISHGSYSSALRITDQQLLLAPDHVPGLVDKGILCLLAGQFSNAIPPLTRVLALTNSYSGRINRALAYVRLGQLEAAEADYQELLRAFPASYQPYNGLAEVALRRGETNAAIKCYQQYLSKAATDSGEAEAVAARLKDLQRGAP